MIWPSALDIMIVGMCKYLPCPLSASVMLAVSSSLLSMMMSSLAPMSCAYLAFVVRVHRPRSMRMMGLFAGSIS